jgi:hypothetical protein
MTVPIIAHFFFSLSPPPLFSSQFILFFSYFSTDSQSGFDRHALARGGNPAQCSFI